MNLFTYMEEQGQYYNQCHQEAGNKMIHLVKTRRNQDKLHLVFSDDILYKIPGHVAMLQGPRESHDLIILS